MVEFDFDKIGIVDSIIKMSYFAFTTLSTIGFGDMYPVNSFERAFMSVIMLAGVATVTYIMRVFIKTLHVF